MSQQPLQTDHLEYGSIPQVVDLDLLQSTQPGYGTRSISETSLNIVNATIGSGILGLPFALYLSGFTIGISISIFVSILTYLAIYSLILSGQRTRIFDFAEMAQFSMGKFGFYMLNLMLFIQSAGSTISYFILVADTIPLLLGRYFPQYTILADRQLVTILVSAIVIFPLNLFRSIGALARWSAFSVLMLPIMIISVLIRAPTYAPQHDAPLFQVGKDPVAAMGTMSFAFVCSQVAYSNFLSQKRQDKTGWHYTCTLATTLSWIISVLFASIGYLSFGKDVSSNIFSNFPADDHVINVGRLALGLSMILTVPMGFYPARDALQKTIGFETPERPATAMQHYSVTVILFTIFLIFGVQINSLGKVYSFVGGLASSFLAYIIPGFTFIAVFHPTWLPAFIRKEAVNQDPKLVVEQPTWWLNIGSVILVLFGTLVMSFTIIGTLRS